MIMPIENTLTVKLVHAVLIILIVAYVVFVDKSSSAVESVPLSAKIVHTPST